MIDPMAVDFVSNIPIPKNYRPHSFMDMSIDAEPVGIDSQTGDVIWFGDGHHVACLLEDKPNFEEVPF